MTQQSLTNMQTAIVTIQGISEYSGNKYVTSPRKPGEQADDWEQRTCRERMHVNPRGMVVIPGSGIMFCLQTAAKKMGVKIKGGNGATYGTKFLTALMVPSNLELGIHVSDVPLQAFHVPADGKKGGHIRVLKYFGMIAEWGGTIPIYILDPIINLDMFTAVARYGGMFVGLGRFRPERGGTNGRFSVTKIVWRDEEETLRDQTMVSTA